MKRAFWFAPAISGKPSNQETILSEMPWAKIACSPLPVAPISATTSRQCVGCSAKDGAKGEDPGTARTGHGKALEPATEL